MANTHRQMVNEDTDLSIYIHIPFCIKRCSYCDFNTYAGKTDLMPNYVEALCKEIRQVLFGQQFYKKIKTVYFGGGTPSLLSIEMIRKIVDSLRSTLEISEAAEITIEANPGSLSGDYLTSLRKLGVNRISIGMQSGIHSELEILGRVHTHEEVIHSVFLAKQSGFSNINLDLIYGLPGQSLDDWKNNLESALELHPEHLSLYALTLEPHVPMQRWIWSGKLPQQDDDLMADMYEYAAQVLETKGFQQYEISNWANSGQDGEILSCVHNLQYWHNLPYLGFGAGAHGFANHTRTANVLRIGDYIRRCQERTAGIFPCGPALKTSVNIGRRREMQETMMLGLRLLEGVSKGRFLERFGMSLEDAFSSELNRLLKTGLISETNDQIHLTPKGRFLSNIVFREFVD